MAKCDRKDCDNVGVWGVGLAFKATGHPNGPEADALLGLQICDEHKKSATVSDFVTDENWAQIQKIMIYQGYVKPDRKSVRLKFRKVAPGTTPGRGNVN